MANVTINIEVSQHGGQNVLRPAYRGLSADIEHEGGHQSNVSDITGMDAVGFIEYAIQDVIQSAIGNGGESQDVTVNLPAEVTLSDGLQTHLTDRFTADSVVSSLTFN